MKDAAVTQDFDELSAKAVAEEGRGREGGRGGGVFGVVEEGQLSFWFVIVGEI